MKAAVIVFPGINREGDMARALALISGRAPAMVWHADTELPPGTDLSGNGLSATGTDTGLSLSDTGSEIEHTPPGATDSASVAAPASACAFSPYRACGLLDKKNFSIE